MTPWLVPVSVSLLDELVRIAERRQIDLDAGWDTLRKAWPAVTKHMTEKEVLASMVCWDLLNADVWKEALAIYAASPSDPRARRPPVGVQDWRHQTKIIVRIPEPAIEATLLYARKTKGKVRDIRPAVARIAVHVHKEDMPPTGTLVSVFEGEDVRDALRHARTSPEATRRVLRALLDDVLMHPEKPGGALAQRTAKAIRKAEDGGAVGLALDVILLLIAQPVSTEDVGTLFKRWLGPEPFMFTIGGEEHLVSRVGLASSNGDPVLLVCGVHRRTIEERHPDNASKLDATRRIDLPTHFQGVRVDVFADD